MRKLIALFILILPASAFAGTITDNFGTGGGTITISSGTAAAASGGTNNITLIQSAQNGGSGAGLSTNWSVNTTANDTLVVMVGVADATWTMSSILDSAGDTFTEAPNSPITGTGTRIRVYTAKATGASASVSMTQSGTAAFNVFLAQYHNVALTSPVDCDTAGTGSGTSLLTSAPTCTTTVADELVSFGFQPVTSVTYTAGASYTIRQQNGGTGHSGAYQDKSAPTFATYTGAMTSDTSGNWAVHMMALKSQ